MDCLELTARRQACRRDSRSSACVRGTGSWRRYLRVIEVRPGRSYERRRGFHFARLPEGGALYDPSIDIVALTAPACHRVDRCGAEDRALVAGDLKPYYPLGGRR